MYSHVNVGGNLAKHCEEISILASHSVYNSILLSYMRTQGVLCLNTGGVI